MHSTWPVETAGRVARKNVSVCVWDGLANGEWVTLCDWTVSQMDTLVEVTGGRLLHPVVSES
jgi:hypothetical protein